MKSWIIAIFVALGVIIYLFVNDQDNSKLEAINQKIADLFLEIPGYNPARTTEIEKEKFAEFQTLINESLKQNEKQLNIWGFKINADQMNDDNQALLADFDRMLELFEGSADVLISKGLALEHLGHDKNEYQPLYEEAYQVYKKNSPSFEQDTFYAANVAFAAFLAGQQKDAEEIWEKIKIQLSAEDKISWSPLILEVIMCGPHEHFNRDYFTKNYLQEDKARQPSSAH